MEQKLLNIKHKLVATWYFLIRNNFYILSFNDRGSKYLESYNILIPEFIKWVKKKHDVPINHEIITDLKYIKSICKDSLICDKINALIKKLEK
jgi:hypothetical protein